MNLKETDPQFIERMDYFIHHEIIENKEQHLDLLTHTLAVLAVSIGCQGTDMFKLLVKQAIADAVDPIVIKEVIYQAADYLGYARMLPFLLAANEVFQSAKIKLPLEDQATTTMENRLEKGIEAQATIFGESMREAWKTEPINYWLASNCFGDYYTRKGLNLAQRELITFCFLMAQGGCEPQLIAHVRGNLNMGNDAELLRKVVAHCLPYIGYPRSLNAMTCIQTVLDSK